VPVYSMTGFGKAEVERENILLSIEVKSVNHRFKDIRFKMSSLFAPVELDLRNEIAKYFKRGSFDVFINYKRIETASKFDDLDPAKVKAFIGKMKEIAGEDADKISIRPTEFLRSEFYFEQDDTFKDELASMVKEGFPKALEDLKKSRASEGKKLLKTLKDHRDQFHKHYEVVSSLADTFQESIKERLTKKFEEYKTALPSDEPRFMQEVIYYLEKADVHEEINRIEAHLLKLDKILTDGGEVGRQIDFLIQELNRETNTTGSKSTLEEISNAVVQMKVHLEKIREQGLNFE